MCIAIAAVFVASLYNSVYLFLHTFPLSLRRQLKDSLEGTTVQGQDRSNATVQKRPVRPILPAYYSTGEIKHTAHRQCSVVSVKISCHRKDLHTDLCLCF